jgi:hypothetical protein
VADGAARTDATAGAAGVPAGEPDCQINFRCNRLIIAIDEFLLHRSKHCWQLALPGFLLLQGIRAYLLETLL